MFLLILSLKYFFILFCPLWHLRKDLNPQPSVLETAALPVELRRRLLKSYNKYKFCQVIL